MSVIQSFIAGQWVGQKKSQALSSAINGKVIAYTHEELLDFNEALDYAYKHGQCSLRKFDFQQRAAQLKALATYLNEHKEELYKVSYHTGATRNDSWIDIEGGIATLFSYASIGRRELPSGNLVHEGPVIPLGKENHFAGTHILVPRSGVAVHINAFNFPVWGLLEKFAANFLAGMPCIAKPATATCYLTEALVKLIDKSDFLPVGSLQLIIGSTGDLLDNLTEQDVVTFTGSATTANKLRSNIHLISRSIPFNAEADSLNAAILASDITPNDAEFDIFVKEVVREMTVKAGQKCTAIRRIIVPKQYIDEVANRIKERLAKIKVGDPAIEGVKMGPVASLEQKQDVEQNIAKLLKTSELIYGGNTDFLPVGNNLQQGAFLQPTLLLSKQSAADASVHSIEAFGPVSSLIPYSCDIEEAVTIASYGRGSLVSTLTTKKPGLAAQAVPTAARWNGRILVLDKEAALESTGHGSPLPVLKHGGPGRAGGGEELGGLRAVKHYLQRTAIQGSPTMLAAITKEYVRNSEVIETPIHPFRHYFEDLQIGESLLTHRRTVTEADIVNFGCLSGDHFYMHFDEIAAKDSQFGKRIAHGYFVLSAAAGLFVSAAPGPVLANYGLDNLRFVNPVGIGDTIQARLTCKRKIDQGKTSPDGTGQGVVAWDVQVTNQHDELVASYDILTLVSKKE
ncbi:phenylacetic acid degradation bifunctional protein PaaZ [Entomomonas asaccharolytica]|uniref:Phenylacetic acid degradation bifunctional protein PaaZ n=1 Tax=Entomomonas asaccharolytica TaxID=2785331 RepID=A0A974NGK0_9GAMM|nr:phenylacetic acid degradation bifunctional protein PaaZ [Entomomonas asaccharolytica]QQP86153.1 phenylacetic acid degradation bifunctional protein PaaZ [Entomomonas asaccharolytica]